MHFPQARPSNLPSTLSFHHRILINLRSPRVYTHYSPCFSTSHRKGHLLHVQLCLFQLFRIARRLYAFPFEYIMKQLLNLKSGHAKLVRRYCKFGNFRESFIFARVLFSRNFAYAKFRENKILTNWRNHSVIF